MDSCPKLLIKDVEYWIKHLKIGQLYKLIIKRCPSPLFSRWHSLDSLPFSLIQSTLTLYKRPYTLTHRHSRIYTDLLIKNTIFLLHSCWSYTDFFKEKHIKSFLKLRVEILSYVLLMFDLAEFIWCRVLS